MKKRDYRRGIAIELAIGMMFLVIALSIILLTVAMLQIKNQKSDLEDYEKKVLEFAVEDMVAAEKESHTVEINKKTYTLSKSNNEYTITVNGTTVYTVTVTDGKISDWK